MEAHGGEDLWEVFGSIGLRMEVISSDGFALFIQDANHIGGEAGHHGKEKSLHGAGGGIGASDFLRRIKRKRMTAITLTGKVKPLAGVGKGSFHEWARRDLNPRPTDYESAALTAELQARAEGGTRTHTGNPTRP